MKVILNEDVAKLGRRGDLVEVSDGYARNYLFAKGLAQEGTAAKVKEWEQQQKNKQQKEEKKEAQAQQIKKTIGGKRVNIKVNAGDEGRLFGSVTSAQVAAAIQSQLGVEIDKRDIKLDDTIKQVGVYQFKIRLYTGVEAELSLSVEVE